MALNPSHEYSAWERALYGEQFFIPDNRGLRRDALIRILTHRCGDVSEPSQHALDALGRGLAPAIDRKAMEALTARIKNDGPAYKALCHITPWHLPTRGLLYEGWAFDEHKIPFTLPYHIVIWLLLDIRARAEAALEWIRLVRKVQDYCRRKDTLAGPIGLLEEIDAFAARHGLLIGEDARARIWPEDLRNSPAIFGRANAQLHRLGDPKTPAWMIIGVQRRFTDEGRAALSAAAAAVAAILLAACERPYAPELSKLIRVTVADADDAIARHADLFINNEDALYDAVTSFHATLASIYKTEETPA